MDIRPRPNLLWRIFVVLGIGTMTALVVSDDAWDAWENNVGDALPRDTIRTMLVGTAGLHAAEGVLAYGSARRGGLERPGRWGLSTFFWGFPVLFRLRRAKRADEVIVVVED